MAAKSFLDRNGFILVIQPGRGAMRIDIIHLLRSNSGILAGELHRMGRPFPLRVWAGDVIGIPRCTIADNFRIDPCTPCLGVLIFLQHQHRAAFPHDKTAPLPIKWDRGPVRVRRMGQRFHVVEPGNGKFRNRRFRPAGYTSVQIAVPDCMESLTHRVGGGRTSRHRGVIDPLKAIPHGDRTSRHIDDHHRDKKYRDPAAALFQEAGIFLLDGLEPADPAACDHADAVRVQILEPGAAVLHCLDGSRDCILIITVGTAQLLLLEIIQRVEVLHFGRHRHLTI